MYVCMYVCIYIYIYIYIPLRPLSLLSISLPRLLDSDFPGKFPEPGNSTPKY